PRPATAFPSFPTRRSSDLEKKVAKSGEAEILTVGMMLRLTEVEDQHPNGYKKWLKGLPVKDRSALRKAMEETEVGIDTTLAVTRSEEHTSELQSRENLVCR